MASFLDELLVKIGFVADEASAKKAADAADAVADKVVAADQRLTEGSLREQAKRRTAEARARGERQKGAAEILDERKAQERAESRATEAAAKRSRQRQGHLRDADRASRAALQTAVISGNLIADAIEKAAEVTVRALSNVIDRFDKLAFASQRTGVSANRIKSLGYAFGQVGGSAEQASAVVEKFAYALRNPGVKSFLNNTLGVATEDAAGKALDQTKVLLSAFDAIEKKYPGADKSYIREQFSTLFGMSYEDFDLLDRRREQIRAYSAEYDRIAKSIGLNSDDAAKASAGFSRALGTLSAIGTALGEKLLTVIVPPLEKLVRTFTDWMAANPEQVNRIVENLAKALLWVAEAVASLLASFGKLLSDASFSDRLEDWTRSLKEVAESIRTIVDAVAELEKKLEVFKKLRDYTKLAGDFALDPFGLRAGVRGFLFGGPAEAAVPSQPVVPAVPPVAPPTPGDAAGKPGFVSRLWQWGKEKAGFGGGSSGAQGGPSGSGGPATAGPSAGTGAATIAPDRKAKLEKNLKEADPEIVTYIREAAKKRGIDPDTALAVADGEGLRGSTPTKMTPGDYRNGQPMSWGPYQLFTGGGLGNEYQKKTGNHPSDASHWREQIDFALDHAKKNGWGAWYGRAHHGVGKWDGINPGGAPAPASAQVSGNVEPTGGIGGVDQRQGGATRNQPITDKLREQIAKAAKEAGVNAEIFSGGQDETGPNRRGSHRHDHGNAADLKLYTIGQDGKRRYLSMENEAERAVMEKFIAESVKAGANGVGAATDYMGPNGIHIGGGSPLAWGKDGKAANAPDWVRRAQEQGMRARGSDRVSSMLDGAVKAADRLQTSIERMPVAWLDKAEEGLSQAKNAVGKVDLDGIQQTVKSSPAIMPAGGQTINDNRQYTDNRSQTISGVEKPQEVVDLQKQGEKRMRSDLIDNFRQAYA